MSLSDRYSPQDVETRIYKMWEEKGYFKSEDQSTKPPFCVILPPPNVTGQLHIGHALNHSLQDILVRWQRMSGFNTNWLPGTDHAGIATQSVVERKLSEEGQSRQSLGREKFVKEVWDWKEQYGSTIIDQMKRLGDSLDWDRYRFTLDESVSKAVRKVFVDLRKKNLIYRGQRLINWSTKLESAISDLEVNYKDIKGKLYTVKYPLADGSGFVKVATTRPETLLGDTAVAVHPEDGRYKKFVGKEVLLPLTERKIPVIADEYVDKEFGSGVVKITPAHDFNDYEVGQRHKLENINILNKNGTLNAKAGKYAKLKVQEARRQVLKDLEEQELLEGEEVINQSVGHCSRSGCVVEPLLSEQWFVKMEPLAKPAREVVETGTVVFEPELWTKTYLHWMNNIKDWCISRQLWWGHRVPAWYCDDCDHITVSEEDPTQCEQCKSKNIKQDEDVLDTWFSSALWPFSTLGWPEETEALKTFYPTNVLVTGHDIIFFWVARMIMMGLEFKGDVPFRKVLITGLVRNEDGQKMSKSLGNAVDPLELIDQYGADALRFTLAAMVSSGKDLRFSMDRFEGYRNFMNKVWNATRFSLSALENIDLGDLKTLPKKNDLTDADRWIVQKTAECEEKVDKAFKEARFSDAAHALYEFAWNEFCAWYLELIKPVMYGDDQKQKQITGRVLAETLNRVTRLLHPFTPYITEEIYQKLPVKTEACVIADYPTVKNDKEWLSLGSIESAQEMDMVIAVITAIRNVRGENKIKPGLKLKVRLHPHDGESQKVLGANKELVMSLARLESCDINQEGDLSKCAVVPLRMQDYAMDVVVYLDGVVDLDEEKKRIQKSIEKLQKEMSGLEGRLNNKNFLKNAPEDVVQQGKQQLEELSNKAKVLESNLSHLD